MVNISLLYFLGGGHLISAEFTGCLCVWGGDVGEDYI